MNFFRIDNRGSVPRVIIDQPIGDPNLFEPDLINASSFREETQNLGDYELIINSPGGNVFLANEIYNIIAEHEGRVSVRYEGLVASASSYLALGADHISMANNAQLMTHRAQGGVAGHPGQISAFAQALNNAEDVIAEHLSEKTGMTVNQSRSEFMRDSDRFMRAEEALSLGLIDEVVGKSTTTPQNCFAGVDPERFMDAKNAPPQVLAMFKPEDLRASIRNGIEQSRATREQEQTMSDNNTGNTPAIDENKIGEVVASQLKAIFGDNPMEQIANKVQDTLTAKDAADIKRQTVVSNLCKLGNLTSEQKQELIASDEPDDAIMNKALQMQIDNEAQEGDLPGGGGGHKESSKVNDIVGAFKAAGGKVIKEKA